MSSPYFPGLIVRQHRHAPPPPTRGGLHVHDPLVHRPLPLVSYYSDSKAEVERLAGALGEGGAALMSLGAYPWSPCYGWVQHRFGVSWQVMLAQPPAGGQPGPCGWLKDRFGFSWRVVPEGIAAWMSSGDTAARDRAFAAVMGIKKLDIAAIQAAFEGRR